MSLSRLRAGLLTLGVAAVVTLTPVASYAGSWTATDPANDMVQYTFTDADQDPTATTVPDATNGDITSIHAFYGARKLTLRMTFTDLTLADNDLVGGLLEVHTKAGRHLMFEGVRAAGTKKADWSAFKMRSGKRFSCRGMTHSLSMSRNIMKLQVPVRCLGKGWVRIGGAGVAAQFTDNGDDSLNLVEQIDDALRAGSMDDVNIAMGPRVHRG